MIIIVVTVFIVFFIGYTGYIIFNDGPQDGDPLQ